MYNFNSQSDKLKVYSKRKKSSIILFVTLVILTMLYVIISLRSPLELVTAEIEESKIIDVSCKIPNLPVNNPEIMNHISHVDRISCGTDEDWVIVNGTHAFVTDQAKAKLGGLIDCKFYDITRLNDNYIQSRGEFTQGQMYKFESVDFIEVLCTANATKWSSFFAGPRSSVTLPTRITTKRRAEHPPLNVLMFGLDSLSRNMFIRKLPSTYEYLTKELGGQTLEGYNIVGDATTQALVPILTGKKDSELPEARKRKGAKATYVDIYPFVWKEFRSKGYLTGFIEDYTEIGAFNLRLKGFKNQPTDFYMRPFFRAAEPYFNNFQKYCIGSVPRHLKSFDYVKSILNFKKQFPKFVFSFLSELSHDSINDIEGADFDIRSFISEMQQTGVLNNTILIVFSDHGNRFADVRKYQQGKQEERKPFFMFVFPTWFRKIYPLAYNNFVTNKKRLSTPFDIHATLQDILNLETLSVYNLSTPNSILFREMSLFREIPANRTCENAHIEPHWCSCLEWRSMNPNSTISQRAAQEFANFLNKLTNSSREMCAELNISKILWAASFHPNKQLLKFKESTDFDLRKADLSGNTIVNIANLQLSLETAPGNGHYEVSLADNIADQEFIFRESDISRINKYAHQATCLDTDDGRLEYLRKYCYCKKK